MVFPLPKFNIPGKRAPQPFDDVELAKRANLASQESKRRKNAKIEELSEKCRQYEAVLTDGEFTTSTALGVLGAEAIQAESPADRIRAAQAFLRESRDGKTTVVVEGAENVPTFIVKHAPEDFPGTGSTGERDAQEQD